MNRKEEIQEIHRIYAWLYRILCGVLVLTIGLWLGIKIGETRFPDRLDDFQLNLWTEGIGVVASLGISVLIVNRVNRQLESQRKDMEKHQAEEELKRRLIKDAGSRSNPLAIAAVEQLRDKDWLSGSSGLLKGEDLEWANLRGVDLAAANLEGTNLLNADLTNASMEDAIVRGAELAGAKLNGTRLFGAELQGAHLLNADLARAHLNVSKLHGAFLNGANFDRTRLFGAEMQGAVMFGARNLETADLNRSVLPDETEYLPGMSLERFTKLSDPGFSATYQKINGLRERMNVGGFHVVINGNTFVPPA